MNILVIGSGGREHAIIKAVKKNKSVKKIYALPGNGGIAADAECYGVAANDIDGILNFAKSHAIDFCIVAPDDPLVLGAVDVLEQNGFKCFGPCAAAAEIEGSKIFSKNLMKKYGIPTAAYETFTEEKGALEYISKLTAPIVVKADGLALGKGVVIAETIEEAAETIKSMLSGAAFGKSGTKIVIEEYLEGPEVSVLSFTDGKTVVPMVSSMDHKRALDGDKGLNTGGMGTIAPNPYYTEDLQKICMEKIFLPTVNAMNSEGRTFKGCLYFGLMLTKNGPKVIEYNCRFGDPETQVVLPLLKTDLLEIMQAVRDEKLCDVNVEFENAAACCVIAASGGYPEHYKKGCEITLPELEDNQELYVAGAKLDGGKLVTSGGRVLGITSVDKTLKQAIKDSYSTIEKVEFEGIYFRRDIGKRALSVAKGE